LRRKRKISFISDFHLCLTHMRDQRKYGALKPLTTRGRKLLQMLLFDLCSPHQKGNFDIIFGTVHGAIKLCPICMDSAWWGRTCRLPIGGLELAHSVPKLGSRGSSSGVNSFRKQFVKQFANTVVQARFV